ncbi:MAG TPA: alpha/beta hydrolase [Solirubrobacterales bacterium]|nr:alpha/beta hydrolase [Solirubrobacterales bacterium]
MSSETESPPAAVGEAESPSVDLGPRAVTYPYRRIERPAPTPPSGPDPYGNDDPEWLRINWREHLRSVDVRGVRLNYAELGEGPPVVFVHGLGGCWQNWLENLPAFARGGYRAIALDLPGFGQSPMPDWEISIPAYGRLVDEFCKALNLHSTAVVGNSMGGFIAAEVATHAPTWIDHLVLVSSAGITAAELRQQPVVAWARTINAASPLAMRLNLEGIRRPGLRQLAFEGVFRHPQRIRRELLYEFSAPAIGAPAFVESAVSLAGYDFLDQLEEITVPTLMIWGRDDRVVPASEAPGFEQRISNSELRIYGDCGHLAMAERPTRFNREVQEFLGRSS